MGTETRLKLIEHWRGMPSSILMFLALSAVIGSDQMISVSAGPNYFTRIDQGSKFGEREPTSRADSDFAASQAAWALGEVVGSLIAGCLPLWMGNRSSLMLFVTACIAGNLMYTLADPSVAGSAGLAIAGKAIQGLGDGGLVLGMGYISSYSPKELTSARLVFFRTTQSLGQTIGTLITIGTASSDFDLGSLNLNPGSLTSLVQACAFVPIAAWAWCVLDDRSPPSDPGAGGVRGHTPSGVGYCSCQVVCWMALIGLYGLGWSMVVYFGPAFLTRNGWDQQWISMAIFGQNLAGLLAGIGGSVVASKFLHDRMQLIDVTGLLAGGIVAALALMLAGDTRESGTTTDQVLFVAGLVLFMAFSNVFSAYASPCFLHTLPRHAANTMMARFKAFMDTCKIPGPLWANYAWTVSYFLAYFPPIFLFAMASAFLCIATEYLSKPFDNGRSVHAGAKSLGAATSEPFLTEDEQELQRQDEPAEEGEQGSDPPSDDSDGSNGFVQISQESANSSDSNGYVEVDAGNNGADPDS